MSDYPEHDRLAALDGANEVVGHFLEWLDDNDYAIAEYRPRTSDSADGARLVQVQRSIDSWLAQFFRIDPAKIEAEKRRMLIALRDAQGLDAEGVPRE